jgi:dihydrofolate reductase
MQKLTVFNLVSLDGYFSGLDGDISWHQVDGDFHSIAQKNANSGRTLIFGRITYELMANYWPTPDAINSDPVIARGMNESPKIVFSKTLTSARWNNTKVEKRDLLDTIRELKTQPGGGLTVLGSGSIVKQLSEAGLIDQYEILVVPVILGAGKTMFEGLSRKRWLKLVKSSAFKNGGVLNTYMQQ